MGRNKKHEEYRAAVGAHAGDGDLIEAGDPGNGEPGRHLRGFGGAKTRLWSRKRATDPGCEVDRGYRTWDPQLREDCHRRAGLRQHAIGLEQLK